MYIDVDCSINSCGSHIKMYHNNNVAEKIQELNHTTPTQQRIKPIQAPIEELKKEIQPKKC